MFIYLEGRKGRAIFDGDDCTLCLLHTFCRRWADSDDEDEEIAAVDRNGGLNVRE